MRRADKAAIRPSGWGNSTYLRGTCSVEKEKVHQQASMMEGLLATSRVREEARSLSFQVSIADARFLSLVFLRILEATSVENLIDLFLLKEQADCWVSALRTRRKYIMAKSSRDTCHPRET